MRAREQASDAFTWTLGDEFIWGGTSTPGPTVQHLAVLGCGVEDWTHGVKSWVQGSDH